MPQNPSHNPKNSPILPQTGHPAVELGTKSREPRTNLRKR
ncbi:hypothetical protein HMPREF0578_0791 [Mobiluncus mulieris 28-1]|nr:hypothetical protein HMPREF0578_0791 [Mobiluncus mulieris 28-1]